MFMRKDEPFKVARVAFGHGGGQAIGVYAYTADEIGTATVGLGNFLDLLEHMTPKTADELAEALKKAAAVARGDIKRPEPQGALGHA